jgi:diadenosine tetraphosphate (Ap4A) HIT family hydrolase
MTDCIFCTRIATGGVLLENEHAVAFYDGFPLSEGHALVVPRQHEADLFDLTIQERAAVWALLDEVHARLESELTADGFNIGVNVGAAAGQTVPHAHVHLIPRTTGDVDDPRGGVRWVLPAKAAYWQR